MIYFSFLICSLSFAQTPTTLNGFNTFKKRYEKNIPHDPKKHTIYSQGGETEINRITNNEFAINFLKKELTQLKSELKVLSERLLKLENKETKTNEN